MYELILKSYNRSLLSFNYLKISIFIFTLTEFILKIKNFPGFFQTGTIADFMLTLIFSIIQTIFMIQYFLYFKNESSSLKKSIFFLPGYMLYSLIYGLMILLGFVFFIFPGIYFMISLIFTPMLSVIEQDSEESYTEISKNLVKNNWWKVFGYSIFLLSLYAISSLNYFITDEIGKWIAAFVFSIISSFFTLLMCSIFYELYLELKPIQNLKSLDETTL